MFNASNCFEQVFDHLFSTLDLFFSNPSHRQGGLQEKRLRITELKDGFVTSSSSVVPLFLWVQR